MTDLKDLHRKRGTLKFKLTSITKFVTRVQSVNQESENFKELIRELQIRYANISSLYKEFDELQTKIEGVCDDNTIGTELNERETFENDFYAMQVKVENILSVHEIKNATHDETVSVLSDKTEAESVHFDNVQLNNIKLPTIQLPKFKGSYTNWIEFRDTYESLIHENHCISDIQKFHYLRASLEDNALQVIKSLEFSATNYSVAWVLLCERFNNNQLLVFNHLKAIFDISNVTKAASAILRQLVDNISKHLRALNSLKLPTDSWDMLIIFIICNKLDKETLKLWEEFKREGDLPTLNEFKTFLKSRADVLETIESREVDKSNKTISKTERKFTFFSKPHSCNYCDGEHLIYHCADFLQLSVEARSAEVKKLKLCTNCLRSGHIHKFCPSSACRKCQRKHNTLLHFENVNKETVGVANETKTASQITLTSHCVKSKTESLLATARVTVVDHKGYSHTCRAILDCGSQTHFITTSLCNKLGIAKTKVNFSIIGINQITSTIDSKCEITIKASNHFKRNISCYIMPTISDNLPSSGFDLTYLNIPSNLQLADPNFNESQEIDLLLGAPLFWDILREGKIKLGKNEPVMQNTAFGWIIAGPLNLSSRENKAVCNLSRDFTVQDQLQKFWEIEDNFLGRTISSQDAQCEEHFKKTVTRDKDGRFLVAIPFKESTDKLGDSKSNALKRFYTMERKLQVDSNLNAQYTQFMREYETLGHMTRLPNSVNDNESYYLPHHGVLKMDSLTTKLRVVFDASSPTDSGWSLNDVQHVGPSLQQELLTILLRFRQHNIVITADIVKMYRQILIVAEDRQYQRIFWRPNPDDALSVFELNTVTYGLASSPYLAIRCLHHLAEENRERYAQATEVIMRDMYVDDLITGAETIHEAVNICNEVAQVLSLGCFKLQKWASNDTKVLRDLNVNEHDLLSHLQNFGDDNTKTLGLQWSSNTDTLTYRINTIQANTVTKRTILSEISKIYDPLGLLAPCIIVTKCIMRQLWALQLSWDAAVPDDLKSKWLNFRNNLKALNQISIPRQVIRAPFTCLELHGFSDASQNAYAACIYMRSICSNGTIESRLFFAKSKVAPVKTTTIPRLELCGALLLAQVMKRAKNALTYSVNCFYWTDSQIVLCWLRTDSSTLQTFVANRVGEIQRITDISKWRHVESKHNPADIASRGVAPTDLLQEQKWWSGPHWLSFHESEWPNKPFLSLPQAELPEIKKCALSLLVNETNERSLFARFSDLTKLKRIITLCYRFINNSRHKLANTKAETSLTGPITVNELNTAYYKLIKQAQQECFKTEIDLLRKNKYLNFKHKFASLTPFLDKDGLLRVGGRIQNSQLTFEQKHPILLASKHELSKLIFRYEHLKLYHCGPQLLLAATRAKFWVLNGRNLARKTVHDCIRCFRVNPKTISPLMGNLPAYRTQPSFPFLNTGTDYAGPFLVREKRGRGVKAFKCYTCIFICLVTKAVHLEIVTDLTKDSFLATLKRFIARRGKPSHLYSDNGTMYVGAHNELSELRKFLKNNFDVLTNELANDDINWNFIPPHAPNFGGIWEAAVKSAKFHLKRVLGNSSLTLEQFMTVLTGIEGILNSRPLSSMSTDPNDFQPLTPAHFLLGRPLTTIPEPDVTGVNPNRLQNLQHIQQLQQHFWQRWAKEYLTSLQQRGKWRNNPEAIKLGTLVLLKDDNLPPYQWKLGRVAAVHPGSDGVIRVTTIQTATGSCKRPVTKVCPLPVDTNTDNNN